MKEHFAAHIRSYFNESICLKVSCFEPSYILENLYLYATLHGIKSIARVDPGEEKSLRELLRFEDNYYLF